MRYFSIRISGRSEIKILERPEIPKLKYLNKILNQKSSSKLSKPSLLIFQILEI